MLVNQASFNNFIKLTITSQLNLNDKVTKIKKSLLEKNNKLLEYVSELVGKVYNDAVETIVLFIMNLESVERKQLIGFAEEVGTDMTQLEKAKLADKSGGLATSVASLKILENLNSYLLDVNEGKVK